MALIDDLRSARDNLGTIIKAQTDAWVAAGCPPTFSIDGESYQWGSWLQDKVKELNGLTEAMRNLSSPFIVRSRGKV